MCSMHILPDTYHLMEAYIHVCMTMYMADYNLVRKAQVVMYYNIRQSTYLVYREKGCGNILTTTIPVTKENLWT